MNNQIISGVRDIALDRNNNYIALLSLQNYFSYKLFDAGNYELLKKSEWQPDNDSWQS